MALPVFQYLSAMASPMMCSQHAHVTSATVSSSLFAAMVVPQDFFRRRPFLSYQLISLKTPLRRLKSPSCQAISDFASLSEHQQAIESKEEKKLEFLTETVNQGKQATIAGFPMHEWIRLQKPARYLGNEFGAIHKPWNSSTVRFCLAYPEVYEVGASNLGHILLYTVLNETDNLLCDRCYFVEADMAACLQRHQKSIFALESRRPLRDFHTIGFSLSYELGCTNVLEMLKQADIPISWAERQESHDQPWDVEKGSHPFVFAGGPTATSNPEPFSDFFDYFAIGDGEDCLPEIGRCLQSCIADGLSRHATLLRLAQTVKGVYVPQLYEHLPGWGGAVFPLFEGVPQRVLRRVSMPDPMQQIGLVPYVETVHDRLTVEIRRGCTRGCRFCQPGMLTRPARDVDPERVVEAVQEGVRKTGYTEFSLLSLSCSDYLALPAVGIEIKNRLKDVPITLSLPSQRVDRFNDDIANIIGGARQGSLTFAPEAGTQRMRNIINKGLTDDELLNGVMTAWNKGWRQVKLYFMIGLPGETDDDVLGIANTVKWLQAKCRRGRQHIAIRLTISNFTPKPHTPFQWHTVSTSEFLRKQKLLKKQFDGMWQVKYSFTDVKLSAMEDFIGRGDRSLGKVMRRAWEMGATNDAWWGNTESNFKNWSEAIEEEGLAWKYRQVEDGEWNVMESLGDERYRGQGGGGKGRLDRGALADPRLDAPLPWDIIDTGVAKWWLKTDLQRALEASTVPDCSHSGQCSECGVCGDDFGDNVVADVPEVPKFEGHYKPNSHRAQRIRLRYSKEGSMSLIGHLDMMRLLDRALRRASLPVSYDRGFHSLPQISSAQPLPLGFTSSFELVDIDLTTNISVPDFRSRLAEQLPLEIGIQNVEEIPLRRADGRMTESLSKLLYAAEYLVVIKVQSSPEDGVQSQLRNLWEEAEKWVVQVLKLTQFEALMSSKNKKKEKKVDFRKRLLELELHRGRLPTGMISSFSSLDESTFVVRYAGLQHCMDGTLRPDALLLMLSSVSGLNLEVLDVHRCGLRLHPPSVPQVDMQVLRSAVQDDAFRALYRRFDGTSLLHGTQPIKPMDASRNALQAAQGRHE